MYPLKTNTLVFSKLKGPYDVRSMPKKRLPAMVDRTVREKATKRASWDKVG